MNVENYRNRFYFLEVGSALSCPGLTMHTGSALIEKRQRDSEGEKKFTVHSWYAHSDFCNIGYINGTKWAVLLASVRKPEMVVFRVNWLTLDTFINHFNKYELCM